MTYHAIPMSYKPKVEAVRKGIVTQTIRVGRKYKVGDIVDIYAWSGKPYYSPRKWSFRTYLTRVTPILFNREFFEFEKDFPPYYMRGTYDWQDLDTLAHLDGIIPSFGEELRYVLIDLNKIKDGSYEGQIIEWHYPSANTVLTDFY